MNIDSKRQLIFSKNEVLRLEEELRNAKLALEKAEKEINTPIFPGAIYGIKGSSNLIIIIRNQWGSDYKITDYTYSIIGLQNSMENYSSLQQVTQEVMVNWFQIHGWVYVGKFGSFKWDQLNSKVTWEADVNL